MPGRTPPEAIKSYLTPLQAALSCLGQVKLTLGSRPQKVGEYGFWNINAGIGIDTDVGCFEASQRFQLIECPPEERESGRYRITTLMYAYNLHMEAGTLSWHWHPKGKSTEARPHMHLPGDARGHYPTPRFTLEEAIEWVIQKGAVPARPDWQDQLILTGSVHRLYRSWHDSPAGES